jgi:hypothetical protein
MRVAVVEELLVVHNVALADQKDMVATACSRGLHPLDSGTAADRTGSHLTAREAGRRPLAENDLIRV